MNGKARLSIAAIVWASACVGLGGPPSPDGLGYRVPSPPTATYHVADTIVVESRPFQQVREYTTTTAITLRMTFERDPDGVRVILNIALAGEVAFESSGQVGPRALTSSSSGSVTGLILWDADRGLPVFAQYRQELEGTSIREGTPPDRTRRTMARRIRLEG